MKKSNTCFKCSRVKSVARGCVALSFWAGLSAVAFAQQPPAAELPEKPAYVAMLKGDQFRDRSESAKAIEAYESAIAQFERLVKDQPDYRAATLRTRIEYCRKQIAQLKEWSAPAAPAAKPSAPAAVKSSVAPAIIVPSRTAVPGDANPLAQENQKLRADAAAAEAATQEQLLRLQTALDILRKDRDRMDRELAEARRQPEATAAKLEEANAALQKAEGRLGETGAERDRLAKDLQELRAAAKNALTDSVAKERDLETLRKDHAAAQESLKKQAIRMEEAQKELEALRLKAEHASPHTTAANPDPKELEKQIAAARAPIQSELDRRLAECESLRSELARAGKLAGEHAKEISALEKKITEHTQTIRELEQQKKQMEDAAALSDKLAKAEARMNELKKQFSDAEDSAEKSRKDAESARKELKKMQGTLARAEERVKTAEVKIGDLEVELAKAHELAKAGDKKLAASADAAKDTRKKCDGLTEENKRLSSELEKTKNDCEQLQRKNEEQEKALRRASREKPPATPPAPAVMPEPAPESPAAPAPDPAVATPPEIPSVPEAAGPADSLLLSGRAQLQQGNREAAVEAAETLIRNNPDDAHRLHQAGRLLLDAGEAKRAATVLGLAASREPDHAAILADMTESLCRSNQMAEALACCKRWAQLDPKSGKAHFNLAVLFSTLSKGDRVEMQEARKHYETALDLGEARDANLEKKLR